MASVCRYHVVDAIVKAFTERHEACNVVNLGAGLETSYFRLKPEKAFRSRLKNKLKLFTRIAMKVVDEGGRRGYILHYALQ